MRIAVLGVGLIGGSIGLAARERLGASVVGYGRNQDRLAMAVGLGAIDRAAESVADACEGADLIFCAAPVAALAELAVQALAAAGPEAVVSDVGSVKHQLVEGLAAEPRFIGGHPLAGAETAGVEHARADLFDGARWYLTPTESTEGELYDRLQRSVADLGARPQAIDAADHDRLMATVSHVPHVVANVLVAEATEALAAESERLPDVGPSFRDATRVAGANPAIWGDIFSGNRDAVAAGVEAIAERLRQAAELVRSSESTEVERWHRDAGERRRELLESGNTGGPLYELRVHVPNRPGVFAEIALELGRAQVNIEDLALYPAADQQSGAVSVWVAGSEEVARASELIRGMGHAVSEVGR